MCVCVSVRVCVAISAVNIVAWQIQQFTGRSSNRQPSLLDSLRKMIDPRWGLQLQRSIFIEQIPELLTEVLFYVPTTTLIKLQGLQNTQGA